VSGRKAPRHVEGHRLLRVTAILRQGVVLPTVWPLPLDGLLATAVRRRLLGSLHGSVPDQHTVMLPLDCYRSAGTAQQWFWLASCALVPEAAVVEAHHWHRRFDHADAENAAVLPPQVYEAHGRYRAHRVPMPVTVADRLGWVAVGHRERVASLLGDLFAVGRKWAQGEGAVLRWEVDDAGEPDPEAVIWAGPGGTVSRPVPARAAAELGVLDAATVGGAVRPPYWRPPSGLDGRHGPGGREWRPVIAPGTRRPG
jgi:hypothetical protein